MTIEEKEVMIEHLDNIAVQIDEFMTLTEMEAYIKGFRNARDAFMDTVDQVYRNNKNRLMLMHGTGGRRMRDDLISRKDFITEMEINIGNNYNPDIIKGMKFAIELINSRPTVFDKEKVIEDLTDWKNDAEKWAAKYDEVGDTDNMDLQDMAVRCYVNAIEIVEKGGIE